MKLPYNYEKITSSEDRMPNYNQSVLIKEVKACFAVIIACVSLFSSSGCEARQTEAPDEPEKGTEVIDNNHENQYEAALGDIIYSDKQEPEAEEPENNEHIVEEEAIKAEEAEKERLEEEAKRKAEEEEKKRLEEEARRKAEEEAKAYPGSLNRLKDVLAERGFSDEANKKILDVYDLVSENYDATYGYRKAPKSEYLEKLIDAVSSINTINVYTTGSPEAVQNNLSYGTPAQFDHADNSLEFLSDYNGVDLNIVLAHELKHVMDGPMNSTIASVHSSAIKAFREGSASRGEDQAQDYVNSRIYSIYVDVEKNITINKEFTTTDMSYQMYENIADEHFECLLGEDRFDMVKSQAGDFVINLRNALVSEFGKDVGENVLKNYFLAARNMDPERLYSSGNEAKQINNLTNELNYFQDLSTASNQQELIDKLDAKIASYNSDIDMFIKNVEGLRTKPEYANVDVTKYIRQYEEYIATATKYV